MNKFICNNKKIEDKLSAMDIIINQHSEKFENIT